MRRPLSLSDLQGQIQQLSQNVGQPSQQHNRRYQPSYVGGQTERSGDAGSGRDRSGERFDDRIDLFGPLRLGSLFRIEIDFCHTFDLVTDNGCINLDRRGLDDVPPE
jgi:hypothetical protein